LRGGANSETPHVPGVGTAARPNPAKNVPGHRLELQPRRPLFFNFGFRPAADVRSYVKNSETKTGSPLLTDADVRLQTPFAIDLLLFGYNSADDRVLLSEPEVVAK
jgi:hypothetical protein